MPETPPFTADPRPAAAELREFLVRHEHVAVLTGAGCSTGSGIPDYRDDSGHWKHRQPMRFAEFTASAAARQRYWARSFAGWRRIAGARPNAAHAALARLESQGRVSAVITQNVDGLHRRAGSNNVIDLHGVLDRVRCLDCAAVTRREALQRRFETLNASWQSAPAALAPDGDARLADTDVLDFVIADCENCGGVLKPDVVFFGESVPAERVAAATECVLAANALLVVGSSLMVLSGFRFARLANQAGLPVAILNRGVTRADAIAARKLAGDCGELLAAATGCHRVEPGFSPAQTSIRSFSAAADDRQC
ncbi:MAG TPA: NAD-dependent protein deacetylase [Woeseiaceae bacterium]|nr:NAD-dependent protein deacetylase [Woeseiaceae bacterium]